MIGMKKIVLGLMLSLTLLFGDWNATKKFTDEVSHRYCKKATKGYFRFLNGVDMLLGGSKDLNRTSYRELRKSRLLLIFSLKDNSKFNLHLRGKFILPQLKNKIELTLSQDDKHQMDNQESVQKNDDVIEDKKMRVGLKYYFLRQKRSSVYAKLNLKLSKPFGPYLKLGLEKSHLSKSYLETTFDNAIYYYPSGNQLSASSSLAFFKYINNYYFIGQGNKLYYKGHDALYLNNTLLLHQVFDLYNRIIYKLEYSTSYSKKERLNEEAFALSAGYFHRFDKHFFLEVIPKFRQEREKRYRDEALVSVNFGILLSK